MDTPAICTDLSLGRRNAREVLGLALVDLATAHADVVALTADLMLSHKLAPFRDAHPDRFFNVGIAEQNLISVSAGLALDGKSPWATTFAAFATMRAHEQVRTDVAYPGLPVRIVGTMGGLSGGTAGPTHSGLEDIGVMRMVPGMTVVAPSDPLHLAQVVEQAHEVDGPVYVRLGRGEDPVVYGNGHRITLGDSVLARPGSHVTIISTGVMLRDALLAAERLAMDGIEARVVDMHTIRPLDVDAVHAAVEETGAIVTAEDHLITNGLGTAVAEVIAEHGAPCRLVRLGIPDLFSIIGEPAELYHQHGYDASGIERAARKLTERLR